MALSSKPPRSSRRQHSPQSGNLNPSNHINSNASTGSSNSGLKRLVTFLDDTELQGQFTDRFLFLIVNAIGTKFKGLTNSNVTVEGVLQNIDFVDKSFKIYAEMDNGVNIINYDDLIDFELENVNLYEPAKEHSFFKTDTDISSRNKSVSGMASQNRERDIEKWTPEPNSKFNLSLDDDGKAWDQFETNEQKFGIKSFFDENLYTTTIDRTNPRYNDLKQKADKLAAEIEGSSYAGNGHLSEERVIKFDDSGLDEEDKYSGVFREEPKPQSPVSSTTSTTSVSQKGEDLFNRLMSKKNVTLTFNSKQDKPAKYVPPSQKKHLESIDPAIISSQKPSHPTLNVAIQKETHELSSTLTSNPAPQLPNQINAKIDKKLNNMTEINSLREFSQNFKIPETFNREKKGGFIPIHTEKMKQIGSKLVKPEATKYELDPKMKQEKKANVGLSEKSVTAEPKSDNQVSEKKDVKPKEIVVKPKLAKKSTEEEPPKASTDISATTAKSDPAHEYKRENRSDDKSKQEKKPSQQPQHHHKLNPKAAIFTPSSNKSSPVVAQSNLAKQSSSFSSPKINNKVPLNNSSRDNPRLNKSMGVAQFFGTSRVPKSNKPTVYSNMNFFASSLKAYEASKGEKDSKKAFQVEMPFVTPPVWSSKEDVAENSYKSFFSSKPPSNFSSPPPQYQQQYMIPPQGHSMHIPMAQIPSPQQIQHVPHMAPGQFSGQFAPHSGFVQPYAVPQGAYAQQYPNGNPRFMYATSGIYHPGSAQGMPYPGVPPSMMGTSGPMPPHMAGGIPPPHVTGPGGYSPEGHGGPSSQGGNRYNRGNNNGSNGSGYRRNH